jgi:hypothetical protein
MTKTTGDAAPSAASSLFRHIEALHGDRPWGAMLDAGTEFGSIRWIQSLATTRWTALTGAESHARQVRDVSEARRRPDDRIVLGNWADPMLLAGERPYREYPAEWVIENLHRSGFAPIAG